MTVYKLVNLVTPERLLNRLLVHVGYICSLELYGLLALLTHVRSHFTAFGQGHGHKGLLVSRISDHLTELHVLKIIGTQAVTVHDQGRGPVKVDDGFLCQTLNTGFVLKSCSKQKITIAVNEKYRRTRSGYTGKYILYLQVERLVVIVTIPELKQVTEYVHGICPDGILFSKLPEQVCYTRPGFM